MADVRVTDTGRQFVIAVVDDELAVREAAENLLRSAGFCAECFASAEDLLGSPRLWTTRCLVLDVGLPGMNGLQLQQHLLILGLRVPIIFITADEDVGGHIRTQALRAGALAFLRKPFFDHDLLRAVQTAVGGC